MAGKELGCGKVFQVLMICDHVDWSTGTFEEVLPDMESLKDCEQFFVVGVIIEFRGTEVAGMESHRVDLTGISLDGEDGTQSVIRSIGFYDDRFIGTQWVRTGAEMKADFKAWKDFQVALVKFHRIPLWVNWVSRITMLE